MRRVRFCIICGSPDQITWKSPLDTDQLQLLLTLQIPVDKHQPRAGAQYYACLSCKTKWCKQREDPDSIHRFASEMSANLLVFSERVYEKTFMSISASTTVDTAKIASSDVVF